MPSPDPQVRRDWYQANREQEIARAQVRTAAARARNQEYVRQLKDVPCLDCGEKYPPFVMDFDHVRGEKLGNICNMVKLPVSLKRLVAEIDKCEVVCSNCHRIRTFNRANPR